MKVSHVAEPNAGSRETRCSRYQMCNAPLCPLDRDIKWRHWFPDEPICTAKKSRDLDWTKNQKKIRKRALDKSRYFTYDMLKRNCRIRTGIRGLSPNMPCESEEKRVEKWLSRHPPKRGMSSKERKEFTQKMRKLRRGQNSPS